MPATPSRKELRQMKRDGVIDINGELNAKRYQVNPTIKALTEGQKAAKDAWDEGYQLCLMGSAGTGKTFLAFWFALNQVLRLRNYEKICYIRSTVQTRNMGFMPGGIGEKTEQFENVAIGHVNKICDREDGFATLKQTHKFQFHSTSFLRGAEFEDSIVIVDECQNMTFHELDTILTRIGHNCRVIFCGDTAQNDLENMRQREESGFPKMIRILENMDEFDIVEFDTSDIVRSGLVKSYIETKNRLGL
jgi:predicted ribonuclease YlaK